VEKEHWSTSQTDGRGVVEQWGFDQTCEEREVQRASYIRKAQWGASERAREKSKEQKMKSKYGLETSCEGGQIRIRGV